MKSKVKYNQTCASIHTPNAARVTNTNFFLLETQCSPNHIGMGGRLHDKRKEGTNPTF